MASGVSSVASGYQRQAPGAQVGVRVGVQAHGEHARTPSPDRAVADSPRLRLATRKAGSPVVVVADPRVDGGGDEQRMAGEPLQQATAALHLLDHRGVEADAGVEQEVPVANGAQADPTDRGGLDGVQQGAGGLDGVVGQAHGAGEDVGRPAGQCRQGRVGPGQAVGGLVQGAVAAQDHDHVHAVVGGALGQPGGVAPAGGGRHLEAVVGR